MYPVTPGTVGFDSGRNEQGLEMKGADYFAEE
jgi:hypothetical protein